MVLCLEIISSAFAIAVQVGNGVLPFPVTAYHRIMRYDGPQWTNRPHLGTLLGKAVSERSAAFHKCATTIQSPRKR